MKTTIKLLSIVLMPFLGFAQMDETPLTKETNNTITVSPTASVSEYPDDISISITLSEYVNTNPENQQTTRVLLEDIESKLLNKLKEFDLKKSDLHLENISETSSTMNNYNYSTTQNRLSSKIYSFKWKSTKEKIKNLLEEIRSNGVTRLQITGSFSNEQEDRMRTEVLEELSKKAESEAKTIARLSDRELGEISSFNVTIGYYSNAVNYPLQSYGVGYQLPGGVTSSINSRPITLTATVTYQLQ